jgi:succinyl-diaminopimelate desuccinylase
MVQLVRDVAEHHLDVDRGHAVARFFTDASVLTPALGGVPTLICGPGSPDQAHVVDEWCDTAEIMTASAIYLGVLQRLAAGPT